MTAAYVYAAVRTPFGKFGGGLAQIRPDDLAATVLTGLLGKTPGLDPGAIDEVVWGNANGAGEENRNVGRMAVLLAGLPTSVPATTVNRLCGSSLDAAMIASRMVETGDADITVAGGVESMTRAPWVLLKPSRPFPPGNLEAVSTTLGWRLVNERMPAARRHHHRRQASPLNDGASAVLLGSETAADRIGSAPVARIAGRGAHALDPPMFGYAPVEAAEQALRRAGIGWTDVGAVELNEAFAVQSLACIDAWGIDPEIVNVCGGAIAIGHPLGASGGRILGTLTNVLQERPGTLGCGRIFTDRFGRAGQAVRLSRLKGAIEAGVRKHACTTPGTQLQLCSWPLRCRNAQSWA